MRRAGVALLMAVSIATVAVQARDPARPDPAMASPSTSLDAFVGRWQIVPDLTHMGRNGPSGDNILRSQTFSFRYSQTRDGLLQEVFAQYPQAKPSHAMPLVADGRLRVCPDPVSCMTKGGSTAAEQTYAWYAVTPRLLVRLFYIKGQPYDYSTVSVSEDGRMMTLISWDPATPQYQNIQVLEKQ